MINKKLNGFYGIICYLVSFFIVGMIVQLAVTYVFSAVTNHSFQEIVGTKDSIFVEGTTLYNAHYSSQAVSNLIIYLILFSSLVFIFRKELVEDFKKLKSNVMKCVIAMIAFGAILYLSSYLISLIYNNFGIGESNNQELIVKMVKINPIVVFFSVVILAPVSEELIFRKSIYNVSNNKIIYYVCSTFVFGLIHMTSTSTENISNWFLMLIPYCLSGLVLSLAYERTDNIYVSIIAHAINNLVAYSLLFI